MLILIPRISLEWHWPNFNPTHVPGGPKFETKYNFRDQNICDFPYAQKADTDWMTTSDSSEIRHIPFNDRSCSMKFPVVITSFYMCMLGLWHWFGTGQRSKRQYSEQNDQGCVMKWKNELEYKHSGKILYQKKNGNGFWAKSFSYFDFNMVTHHMIEN